MRIVHFSITPCAGQPINIVRALQAYTDHDARLIDLERWGLYEHDLVFSEDLDQALELAEKADLIHLHNYLDLDSKDFSPIAFRSLRKEGKAFVRQFHSSPGLIAQNKGVPVSRLELDSLPSLVCAQFQERFYPKARPVPLIIPQDHPDYQPDHEAVKPSIFFAPTHMADAWTDRWNTKGAPETLRLIKRVARRTGCAVRFMTQRPITEILRERRKCAVMIDELITGSYHTSSLEGLSVGKPVLTFLDHRVRQVLQEISGSDACPFVNVRLENAFEVLVYLIENPDEAAWIGTAGREWIERFWTDRILVGHFVEAYQKLLADPGLVRRQECLCLDSPAARFFAVILPDLLHMSRLKTIRRSLTGRIWAFFKRFITSRISGV